MLFTRKTFPVSIFLLRVRLPVLLRMSDTDLEQTDCPLCPQLRC